MKILSWISRHLLRKFTASAALFLGGIFLGFSTSMISNLVFFCGTIQALAFYVSASLSFMVGAIFLTATAWKIDVTLELRKIEEPLVLPTSSAIYFLIGMLFLVLGFIFTLLAGQLLMKIT